MLLRTDIINHLIKTYEYKSYLEVGVATGINFDKIDCPHKVGVDPSSQYPNIDYKMVSDDYFKSNAEKFDIIFIDGHHEHKQLVRYITNALKCLNEGGSIVCHDIAPANDNSPNTGSGNCWKGWVEVRTLRDDIIMRAVDTDHGCGVIQRGNGTKLDIDDSEINWANYAKNKRSWANLITTEDFWRIYV